MSASCTEPEVTTLTLSADLPLMRQASESPADRASTFDAIDTTVEPPPTTTTTLDNNRNRRQQLQHLTTIATLPNVLTALTAHLEATEKGLLVTSWITIPSIRSSSVLPACNSSWCNSSASMLGKRLRTQRRR